MKYFGWVFLFFTVVYLLPLASRPLCMPDEFACAASAHEMVLSGQYLRPVAAADAGSARMPLGEWAAAVSIRLFGANSFAVRFPMAVAAGLMALFVWIVIKQSVGDEKLAALAAMILLCCGGIYLGGTSVLPECLGAMFIVGEIGCVFMAVQEKKFNRRKVLLIVLAGAFAAGAFLAGGLPALAVMLLPQLVYCVLEKYWKELPLLLLPAMLIAALLILPWAVRAGLDSLTAWQSLAKAQFCSRHDYPWYTVLLVFLSGTFPVALLIPAACFVGRDAWPKLIRQPLYRYALCFFVVTLLFALVPGMREPRWMLAAFAPLAVLIAAGVRAYFNSGGHHRSYNWIMSLWGGALILGGICLVTLSFFPGVLPAAGVVQQLPVTEMFCPVIGFISICSGGFMLYSLTGNWRGRLYLFFFGLGLLPLCSNWLIADNPMMPEKWYQEIKKEFDCDSENCLVYTARSSSAAAAWSLRDCKVAGFDDIRELSAVIEAPERRKPVLVIVSGADKKSLPATGKRFTAGSLTALYYPVNTRK